MGYRNRYRRSKRRPQYDRGNVEAEGVIKYTRYQNGDFAIVALSDAVVTYVDDNYELYSDDDEYEDGCGDLICQGNLIEYKEGVQYIMKGIIKSTRYGNQLFVSSIDEIEPDTDDELLDYLLACKISGVGKGTIQGLIDACNACYGNAVDTMLHHPEILLDMDVPNAQSKRAKTLIEYLCRRNGDLNEISARNKLIQHGLNEKLLGHVLDYFDTFSNAWAEVQQNPYVLMKVDGIGFKRADKVAMSMGVEAFHPRRLVPLIMDASEKACADGSTITTKADILKTALKMLGHEPGSFSETCICDVMNGVIDKGWIVELDGVSDDELFCLQPKRYHDWEQIIKENAARMVNAQDQVLIPHDVLEHDINVEQQYFKQVDGYELDDEQLNAARLVFENRLSLFTGDAGTGKTSTIKMIIRLAQRYCIPFALCSPTGMAAERITAMCEEIGSPAKAFTIHKMLGRTSPFVTVGATADFNAAELVICDETSMLDTQTASRLFAACGKNNKRLLFIGDVNQLPSVGAGDVFRNLLDCKDINNCRLTEIHRQDKGPVLDAAEVVKQGISPIQPNIDVEFHPCGIDDNSVMTQLDEIVARLQTDGLSLYGGKSNMAFLTPTNDYVDLINTRLRTKFNSNVRHSIHNDDLQCGDFVMQIHNKYKDSRGNEIPVMNGKRGIVKEVNNKVYKVKFFGIDDIVVYTKADADEYLRLAYGSTVHKYQGSQCNAVVLIMTRKAGRLRNRNLLYTAITRAEERLILVGEQQAFIDAAYNLPPIRLTGLKDLRLL